MQPDRIRKSVGAETTFEKDLAALEEMKTALQPIIDKVWRYCENSGVRGRTVTLKVKFSNFQQITRSRTLPRMVENRAALNQTIITCLPVSPIWEDCAPPGRVSVELEYGRGAREPSA
ncbi:hypothetical protein [Microvirga sp. BSC39]|uniref:DinB/UmuC family translesion DNA polymerase n=1 Tax=Microvirga sp. BSC39 TaxID=1549810 RepID=UPI00068C6C02|nr:hypothetical protein [Microvirga sp. BSC39]